MAASTGEGSRDSEAQADPEWAATPARSRPRRTGSASTPATPRHTRWGRRPAGSGSPTRASPLDGQRRRGRGGATRARARAASSASRAAPPRPGPPAAAPKPTMPGTFSIPARRARSCSPPTSSGSMRRPRRTTRAPAPGRAAELVGADRDQVGVEPGQVEVDVAAGRGGVHVDRHPGPPASGHHLGHRLDGAHLVVGPLAVHEGRRVGPCRARASATPVGVDPAPAVDGEELGGGQPRGGVAHAECSTAAQSTTGPGPGPVAAPRPAALAASVPPEVKTTWRGRTPSSPATCPRASSSSCPHLAALLVHPAGVAGRALEPRRRAAAPASGRGGEVEAWSR